MSRSKSRRRGKPTALSIGDWLSRKDTKDGFRKWQAEERARAGLRNPARVESSQGSTSGPTPDPTPSLQDGPTVSPAEDLDSLDEYLDGPVTEEDVRREFYRRREAEMFDRAAAAALTKFKQDPELQALSHIVRKSEETLSELADELTTVREQVAKLREIGEEVRSGQKSVGDVDESLRSAIAELPRRVAGQVIRMLDLLKAEEAKLPKCPTCYSPVREDVEKCPRCGESIEWIEQCRRPSNRPCTAHASV